MNGSEHFDRVGIPISDTQRRALALLAGFEVGRESATIRDGVIAGHPEADRYRHQLINLCVHEGIDPGQDPHAALLAHLGGRGPGRGAER